MAASDDYISDIKGDISNDPKIIEIPELVVHGNPPRCWQCGWGQQYGTYNDDTRNRSGYRWPKYAFPVHGIQDSNPDASGSVTNILRSVYSDISPEGGHAGGNPGIVMYLKIRDFNRSNDGTLSCLIENAYIRQHPGPLRPFNQNPPRRGVIQGDIYGRSTPEYSMPPIWWSRSDAAWKSYCDSTLSQINMWNRAAYGGTREGAWYVGNFHFEVKYDFIVGNENDFEATEGHLITKTKTSNGWSEQEGKDRFSVKNKTIVCNPRPVPGRDDRVLFVLKVVNSHCRCDQTGKTRPIFAIDITNRFKKRPYVWRRFGNNASEDPDGAAIDPAKLDGKWHLVQPLYVRNSKSEWKDIAYEEEE